MSQRKDDWRTLGGIDVPKIVGPDESGKPPYTRGIHSEMYRSDFGQCDNMLVSVVLKKPTRGSNCY